MLKIYNKNCCAGPVHPAVLHVLQEGGQLGEGTALRPGRGLHLALVLQIQGSGRLAGTTGLALKGEGQNSYFCTYDLMRAASITRASGRGLGPGNRDFFGPCEMASSR